MHDHAIYVILCISALSGDNNKNSNTQLIQSLKFKLIDETDIFFWVEGS